MATKAPDLKIKDSMWRWGVLELSENVKVELTPASQPDTWRLRLSWRDSCNLPWAHVYYRYVRAKTHKGAKSQAVPCCQRWLMKQPGPPPALDKARFDSLKDTFRVV